MKTLQRVESRRRLMLLGMAKQDMLKGDFKRMLGQLGYDGSKRTLDPTRFKPPVDNTQDFMQKWVQVALNVLLGTRLKVDGKLGPITRQAIKRLQRQEGLTAHGYMDDRTLQVLEMRVGVRSPRAIEHEAVPHLLMLPRRGMWKPNKDRNKPKRKKGATGGPEHDAEHSDSLKDAEKPASPGILQDEAVAAVQALAFDEAFVQEAAQQLDREDHEALTGEMNAWFTAKRLANRKPKWVTNVENLARTHEEDAASLVRKQWWKQKK